MISFGKAAPRLLTTGTLEVKSNTKTVAKPVYQLCRSPQIHRTACFSAPIRCGWIGSSRYLRFLLPHPFELTGPCSIRVQEPRRTPGSLSSARFWIAATSPRPLTRTLRPLTNWRKTDLFRRELPLCLPVLPGVLWGNALVDPLGNILCDGLSEIETLFISTLTLF